MRNVSLILPLLFLFACMPDTTPFPDSAERWTAEEAGEWQQKHCWLAGGNFTPGTAINQLEFCQPETFDP